MQSVCNLWTLCNTNQLLLALDMHDVVAWQPQLYPEEGRGKVGLIWHIGDPIGIYSCK